MGADLYMEPDYTRQKKAGSKAFDAAVKAREDAKFQGKTKAEINKLQKVVEKTHDAMFPESCYFRDSYNGSSVMWRLGISWWTDIVPITGKKIPNRKQIEEILALVEGAELKPLTLEWMKEAYIAEPHDEKNLASWQKYFERKKKKLVSFLKRALREKKKIEFSL